MLTKTDLMLGHKTNQDKSLKTEIMCFHITVAFNLKKSVRYLEHLQIFIN